ncbi:MAG TPA: acylphosphatase [Chthoniobacterales bacterium]|nr:acylphosphatase [Chthoniobacterales bacterium]
MISTEVLYEGHVQGVGFRYTVKQIAKGFDVTGWVRNLPDGRVELRATGAEDEVRAFLSAIGESELRAHIHNQIETAFSAPPTGTKGFQIRHD